MTSRAPQPRRRLAIGVYAAFWLILFLIAWLGMSLVASTGRIETRISLDERGLCVVLLTQSPRRPGLQFVNASISASDTHSAWAFAFDQDIQNGVGARFPLWFVCALLGIPATVLLCRVLSRLRRNLCPACAYSLAGLPPQAPCPECGRPR